MLSTFIEFCVFQVKPDKVDEFETLLADIVKNQKEQAGVLDIKYSKREYNIDFEQIKQGLPPKKLTRIVKSVKYMLCWEFDTKENYGMAQKNMYETYDKRLSKCLIEPHTKYLGERIF